MATVITVVAPGLPARSAPPAKSDSSKAQIVSGDNLKSLKGAIEIDGSSTVYLVSEAAAEAFKDATKSGVNITVGIAGTGGGFNRFCKGELDIADASRPISKKEIDAAKANKVEYIELPIAFDAITVAVHKSNKLNSIKVSELKKMWEPAAQGKITKWNQVNPAWPNEKLKLFGAGTDSGTFDYFTEAINGKSKSSRTDYSPSEDDNTIVQGVSGTKTALGFLPFGYYEQNKDKIKGLAIEWDEKKTGPVEPTMANVLAAKYNPLTRPLFIYVNRKSADRPEVKAFVEFYIKNAAIFVSKAHYAALPETAYGRIMERFTKLQIGTGYNGQSEIGMAIDEILNREPK
ncbi:MAG: PstS family phosphate ABC transporter substrate-binding protein [Planctomycetes bacterium]|nr:PstS family phosphate ABC transporter substrate-binding protein [Planctomycetota bacterium]